MTWIFGPDGIRGRPLRTPLGIIVIGEIAAAVIWAIFSVKGRRQSTAETGDLHPKNDKYNQGSQPYWSADTCHPFNSRKLANDVQRSQYKHEDRSEEHTSELQSP